MSLTTGEKFWRDGEWWVLHAPIREPARTPILRRLACPCCVNRLGQPAPFRSRDAYEAHWLRFHARAVPEGTAEADTPCWDAIPSFRDCG